MYAMREAAAAFRRAPLLTGLSAAMVGLALYVVGLFGLAAYNLELALTAIEERVEVVVYLRDDARQSELDLVLTQLAEMPEVRTVRFVSKREALERARTELHEFGEIFAGLEEGYSLPQSLEVELHAEARSPETVLAVSDAAMAYPFVEDARYGREWVDKLFMLRRIGAATTLVLGSAFALVAALIIATALRIAVFARREEIHVMRLVGAKNSFIRRPFLLEGAIAGLLGGLAAWAATYATYEGVYELLFEVAWIPPSWVTLGILTGVLFGTVASALALRRHLREI